MLHIIYYVRFGNIKVVRNIIGIHISHHVVDIFILI